MTSDLLHELLLLWPSYQALHEYLRSGDARNADPRDLVGPILAHGPLRCACLLHGHMHTDTLTEAGVVVGELLAMCEAGRRPRYGAELGLTIEDFA